MNDWISVKNKLPKPGRYMMNVIVHKENGVVMECYWNGKIEKFLNFDFTKLNHKVTHWMPLPEPPKVKGETNE